MLHETCMKNVSYTFTVAYRILRSLYIYMTVTIQLEHETAFSHLFFHLFLTFLLIPIAAFWIAHSPANLTSLVIWKYCDRHKEKSNQPPWEERVTGQKMSPACQPHRHQRWSVGCQKRKKGKKKAAEGRTTYREKSKCQRVKEGTKEWKK